MVFTEDVVSSFGESGEFKVVMPLYSMMKAIADGFLPGHLDSNTYLSEDPELGSLGPPLGAKIRAYQSNKDKAKPPVADLAPLD